MPRRSALLAETGAAAPPAPATPQAPTAPAPPTADGDRAEDTPPPVDDASDDGDPTPR